MLQDSSSRDEHRQEHSRGLTTMKVAAAQLLGVVAMFTRQWSREQGSQAKMGCTESAVGDSGGISKALMATEVVGGVPQTKSWRVTPAGKKGGQVSRGKERGSSCPARCHKEHNHDGKQKRSPSTRTAAATCVKGQLLTWGGPGGLRRQAGPNG